MASMILVDVDEEDTADEGNDDDDETEDESAEGWEDDASPAPPPPVSSFTLAVLESILLLSGESSLLLLLPESGESVLDFLLAGSGVSFSSALLSAESKLRLVGVDVRQVVVALDPTTESIPLSAEVAEGGGSLGEGDAALVDVTSGWRSVGRRCGAAERLRSVKSMELMGEAARSRPGRDPGTAPVSCSMMNRSM